MNKTTKTVALFTVLSLTTVGCQKENIIDFAPETTVSEASTVYTVQYAVDGIQYQATFHNKVERTEFFRLLLAMAQNGHEVIFYDGNGTGQIANTKEVVYYTTSSQEDALNWASKMYDQGYMVTITFDPDNKVYNCVARR